MPSAPWIDQFNSSYLHTIDPQTGHYRRDDMFAAIGLRPDANGVYLRPGQQLTGAQRTQMQRMIEAQTGHPFPHGVTVDGNGNVNEPEGLGHELKKWGPIAGGVAATLFGVPGLFPGLLTGGTAAAGGAAAFDALPNIGSAAGAANAAGIGGAGLADALAGLGATGAGLASSSIPASLAMHAPGAIASQGASAGVPLLNAASAFSDAAPNIGSARGAANAANIGGSASGGGSLLRNILHQVGQYAPTALAGANAVRQLTQGAPQAQQDLERILGLAEGRINQTEPLFQALNSFAMAGLPDYAKGGR